MDKETDHVWLTADEAAEYLRTGAKLVYREVRAGRLRGARVGGRRELRFKRQWCDDFFEATAKPVIVSAGIR